jgi:hypothetical protein
LSSNLSGLSSGVIFHIRLTVVSRLSDYTDCWTEAAKQS